MEEDAPANAVGGGNIAGVGVGPKGEPGRSPMVMLRRKRRRFKQFVSDEIKESVLHEGFDAWHGSPHSFKEFSRKNTAHSGEGGAAYGSGIYISNTREVGEHYRDMKKGGHLYKVHVKSDPARMMHWNKPVSQQSSHVKKALKAVSDFNWHDHPDPPAKHIFHHLRKSVASGGASRSESSEYASNVLHKSGVHGITYEGDIEGKAKSRPTNHVIFNPKHIQVSNKYDSKGKEVHESISEQGPGKSWCPICGEAECPKVYYKALGKYVCAGKSSSSKGGNGGNGDGE